MKEPFPFLINKGLPSTALKALTGEFTPPGKYSFALLKCATQNFYVGSGWRPAI